VSNSFQSVYINGVLTENQQLIADSFENYFLSTTDKIISNSNNSEDMEDNCCIVYLCRVFNDPFLNIIFDHTTISEIETIIKYLTSKNSYGYEEISVKVFKISLPYIVAPLNYICNRSILWVLSLHD
jgi:hypothetical protein